MRLGFILLKDFQTINSFEEIEEIVITEGNATRVHFRLVDLDQEDNGSYRYIPSGSPTITVQLAHIDESKSITRSATMVSADDKSIWYFDLTANDKVAGGQMQITLNEAGNIRKAILSQAIGVDSPDSGRNFC